MHCEITRKDDMKFTVDIEFEVNIVMRRKEKSRVQWMEEFGKFGMD